MPITINESIRTCDSFSSHPPGSACSIYLGEGLTEMKPGTQKGLQMVVQDVAAVRKN